MFDPANLKKKAREFESIPLEELIVWAWETLGPRLAFGTAFGSSGMVLLHVLQKTVPETPIFTIDTGFLFPETNELIARVEKSYGISIERLKPRLSVEGQAELHGPSLYERNPDQCCWMRKVEPLQRRLDSLNGWITSLRRDQGPNRENIGMIEAYQTDSGRSLVKLNPLANWTRKRVWDYILENDVPYNPLMDRGFPSVGCWPCTSAVSNDENERAGRWANSSKVECGIHTFLPTIESPEEWTEAAAGD